MPTKCLACLLTCLLLVLTLPACGGKGAASEPEGPNEPAVSVLAPQPEPEPEPEKESGSGGALVLILLLAALGGGGAFAYIKSIKPKHVAKVSADPDDYEFEDEEVFAEDNN